MHNTYSTFFFQNLIFSINDGFGLSTYLDLLTEVIEKLGLFKFKNTSCRFEEITMTPIHGESNKETFDRYIKLLQESSGYQLVCLDISEFITRTGLPEFRSFLKALEDIEDKYIFVFRLPFVEADILEKICSNIDDVLYSRTVTVAPFTLEELHLCAEKAINEFGFKMTEDSWDVFDSIMSEEKNDGRFYGLNTVRKIVYKIVYKKTALQCQK